MADQPRKRVLIATTWFPTPDRPLVAPFNVEHAAAIARDYDVEIAHLRLWGTGDRVTQREHAGLPVTELPIAPGRPTTTITSYRHLRNLVRNADVVHSMAFSSLGVLAPLHPVIADRWVHTEHWSGVTYPERVSETWRRLAPARHLLRLPRRVGVVTKAMADAISPFTRRDAVELIPCVVADSFRPTPQPSWSPLKLVAVGGLIEGKRPLLAVDTIRHLVDSGIDVTLTWVGDGDQRERVERHIEDSGLTEQVRLIGGVKPDEVANHVRAANLFFLPTASENFFTAAAEAIACGRPVVLPRTGGFVDYVTDSNGVLTEEDDAKALALAIQTARDRFLDVPAEVISETVLASFSSQAIAKQFAEFYRTIERQVTPR